ncbi:hypothetical protein B0J11DRAFT_180898 [Dendryphion nanum]|uniref:Uncharacterized protein n=1 Tax=Dendryphion nanum TaxID=256645 RepID=A0A9P9D3H5_9PLEO|nr:hypothetical protein B0J11DRAFT_180898 [Dendryphion nanum]
MLPRVERVLMAILWTALSPSPTPNANANAKAQSQSQSESQSKSQSKSQNGEPTTEKENRKGNTGVLSRTTQIASDLTISCCSAVQGTTRQSYRYSLLVSLLSLSLCGSVCVCVGADVLPF